METRTAVMPKIEPLWYPEPVEDTRVYRDANVSSAKRIVRDHISAQFGTIPVPKFQLFVMFHSTDNDDWSIFFGTDMPDKRIFNVQHYSFATSVFEYDQTFFLSIPDSV